jgi:hypothetical protein
MAVITPKGIERALESTVTASEAIINGKMPKSGGDAVGYQAFPNKKLGTETTLRIGTPSIKRKRAIKKRLVIEAREMPKNMERIRRSFF